MRKVADIIKFIIFINYILIYSQFAEKFKKQWHNDNEAEEAEEEKEYGGNYIQWLCTPHLTEHAIT